MMVRAMAVHAAPPESAASAPAPELGAGKKLTVLKKEPAVGHLRSGEQVLVDDGGCPAGEIKELTGGRNRQCGEDAKLLAPGDCELKRTGPPRTARCVKRE